jgi:hypothetical protein
MWGHVIKHSSAQSSVRSSWVQSAEIWWAMRKLWRRNSSFNGNEEIFNLFFSITQKIATLLMAYLRQAIMQAGSSFTFSQLTHISYCACPVFIRFYIILFVMCESIKVHFFSAWHTVLFKEVVKINHKNDICTFFICFHARLLLPFSTKKNYLLDTNLEMQIDVTYELSFISS